MLYNAKGGIILIDNTETEYISFGKGDKNLIMIPGLGEGLRSIKGLALPMAYLYRMFARDYKVYFLSRKNVMPQGYSTKDMADDIKKAMDLMNIEKADIIGVSQGGMIAQHFAADYPEYVNKLVLAVTCGKANECVKNSVTPWIEMAKQGRYHDLMTDNFKMMYTDKYLKKNRLMLPFATRIGLPKSYKKFIVMAEACLTHDSMHKLDKITAPTLIIGGEQDKVVDGKSSYILNEKIKNSKLLMYNEYGHSVYDEAKDFNCKIKEFLK